MSVANSVLQQSVIGASLGSDKPCKRDSIELLLRQDARPMLRQVLDAGHVVPMGIKLAQYAMGEDYWQAWYALDYLASNGQERD